MHLLGAQTKDGRYLLLLQNMDREQLKGIRNTQQFFCPQCKEAVMLKIGQHTIPHFSHYPHSSCPSLFSEGESALHLAGKQQLYQLFTKLQRGTVQVEPYFSTLDQRPDLLYTSGQQKIPIEFQCSRIPSSKIAARTAGYQKADMSCQWIVQTPEKLSKLPTGLQTYSISAFERNFLRTNNAQEAYLFSYNAYTKNFHYFGPLLHCQGNTFFGQHHTLPLMAQHFPFLHPKSFTLSQFQELFRLYKIQRHVFLQRRIFYNRRGINDPFLRHCYECRILPRELPAWIGLPMGGLHAPSEHACEWQLDFLYELKKATIDIRAVSKPTIEAYLQTRGWEEERLPMIQRYVSFLQQLGIDSIHTTIPQDKMKRIAEDLFYHLQNEMKIEKI